MKKNSRTLRAGALIDLRWLPAPEEWDFRRVQPDESRLACCWEYARSSPIIRKDPFEWADAGPGYETSLAWVLWYGSVIFGTSHDFPDAWLSLPEGMREGLVAHVWSPDATQVWSAGDLRERLKRSIEFAKTKGIDPSAAVDWVLKDGTYLVKPEFTRAGAEKIIPELNQWVRAEAKKYPRHPRARGAAPPIDCLKWLAATRLEEARLKAGLRIEDVQVVIKEWQRVHSVKESQPVLPVYASHGAWSKAIRDARRLLELLEKSPQDFERKAGLF